MLLVDGLLLRNHFAEAPQDFRFQAGACDTAAIDVPARGFYFSSLAKSCYSAFIAHFSHLK